jgi:hypothetical protein
LTAVEKLGRVCAWCRGDLDTTARIDARTCSKRCRQALHRFTRDSTPHPSRSARATDGPRRFAYADPPYPGLSAKYYSDHADFAGEVDHRVLLEQLQTFDGWVLSTNARSLPFVLDLCHGIPVRVGAWVRGTFPHPRPKGPLSSWEPVVYAGWRDGSVRADSLVYHSRPRLTDVDRVIGAKLAVYARWVFELLGATAGDSLDDLFPGSGGIARSWSIYTSPVDRGDVSLLEHVEVSLVDEPQVSPEYSADMSRRPIPGRPVF